MNLSYSSYPGRFLMPEPMTDPPMLRSPLAGRGPPIRTKPTSTEKLGGNF